MAKAKKEVDGATAVAAEATGTVEAAGSAEGELPGKGKKTAAYKSYRKVLKFRGTFMEEVLGTNASNPHVHGEYIASLAPDAPSKAEEVAAIGPEAVERAGKTVFPKQDDKFIMWDYMVKGFLKHAASALSRAPDSAWSGIQAFKKVITQQIFIFPRAILLQVPEGAEVPGSCQRPLQGQTAQGPKITLANSESLPAGTFFDFEVLLLDYRLETGLMQLLDYGELIGLGQWRNAGKGKFTYKLIG